MRNILITGARGGIAKKVIDKLKNKGYYIYATTRTEGQAKILKDEYKDYKNIECFKLDILSQKDRNKIVDKRIDVLLCNAAISYGGSLVQIDVNKVRENYEVNVFANLELIQLCLKQMINNEGKIIIMSSLAGIIPISFIGSYCSTKASLIKIAQVLKKELKMINDKVKICLIEPGMYLTGFNRYMFMNKYDDNNKYFRSQKDSIVNREEFILNYLAKKDINSISNKIVKAIEKSNNKFIYRAPFIQVLGAKIYSIFKE